MRRLDGIMTIAGGKDEADELQAPFLHSAGAINLGEEIWRRQIDMEILENWFDVKRKLDGRGWLHLPLGGGYTGSLNALCEVSCTCHFVIYFVINNT